MKKLNLVIVSLFVISSVAYSDVISDLTAKKNNTQKQGITYNVVINGREYDKMEITEKGNNKLVKRDDMYTYSYLFENGKIYSIPDQWQQTEKNSPLMITVIPDAEAFKEDLEECKIPDYSEYKAVRKETVNGYPCQVLQKVVSSKDMEDEMGNVFNRQEISRIYVNEKNGYPVKVITYVRSKYKNEKNYTDYDDKESLDAEMLLSDFSTDLSGKMLTLPKNAYVVDPANPGSVDTKKLMDFYKQLADNEDDEDEE